MSADDAWVTIDSDGQHRLFCTPAILVFNRERKQQQKSKEEFGRSSNAPNSIAVLNLRGGFEFGNQAGFARSLALTDKHRSLVGLQMTCFHGARN